jgi:alcohol dehydrogenase class IV
VILPEGFSDTTLTPHLHYGPEALIRMVREMDRRGLRRVVLVCGSTLAREAGPEGRIGQVLGDRLVAVFDGVQPHSPAPSAITAARYLKDRRADAVLSAGGGSAIVTARAAGILLGEDRPLNDLFTRFDTGRPVAARLTGPKLPQFVLMTVPTTAAVKIGAAVLDPSTHLRGTMADPAIRPVAVAMDPALATEVPAGIARDAALNAFAMAVQGLESPRLTPMTEALLLQALTATIRYLPDLGTARDGPEVRGALMVAAALTGRATDGTGLGLASVTGHVLGARYGIGNGAINAAVLPALIRFNAPATCDRLAPLRDLFPVAPDAAIACGRFLASLGAVSGLAGLGIDDSCLLGALPRFPKDVFLYHNPRPVTDPAILQEAMLSCLAAENYS